MNEPNWIVTLIIGVAISIPISLLTNLATPHVQAQLDKRALSNKGKRLKQLQQEYERVKELHNNLTLLTATIGQHIVTSLSLLLIVMIVFSLTRFSTTNLSGELLLLYQVVRILSSFIGLVFAAGIALVANRLLNFSNDLARLRNFEQYQASVLAQISKLQEQGASAPLKGTQANDSQDILSKDTSAESKHTSTSTKPATEGDLIIRNATYGAEGHRKNVTDILKTKMSGGKLEICATNGELGGDPAPLTEKELRVDYTYRGKRLAVVIQENQTLSLP